MRPHRTSPARRLRTALVLSGATLATTPMLNAASPGELRGRVVATGAVVDAADFTVWRSGVTAGRATVRGPHGSSRRDCGPPPGRG